MKEAQEASFVRRALQLLEHFNTQEFMISPSHQSARLPRG